MRALLSRWAVYLRLMFLRVLKIFPRVFLISLLLFSTVLLFAGGVFSSEKEDITKKRVLVGIAGETDDPILSLAIDLLSMVDSSSLSIEFKVMEEDEARAGMRSGELQAYVLVPEGFVESLNYYTNDAPMTFVSTDGAVGVGTLLVNEIAESVSGLVLETENAVYGMQTYAKEHFGDVYTGAEIGELGYRLVETYGLMILAREDLFEITEMPNERNLSFTTYYLIAAILIFLLFWGITLSPLYAERDPALSRLLAAGRLSVFSQVAAEYLSYALTMLVMTLLLIPAAGGLLFFGGISIPEFEQMSAGGNVFLSCLQLIPSVIPAVFLIASLQFFLYELANGMIPGILLQAFTGLIGGYLSGCFYPVSYFPEFLKTAGDLLPVGTARQLISAHFFGGVSMGLAFRAALFILLFLLLAALVRAVRGRKS